MNKLIIISLGAATLIAGKLKIMGGVNYFRIHQQIPLNDKTILITGGTDGIGWQTAKKLSTAKEIIVAGRNYDRIKDNIKQYPNFTFMKLDLNDLDNVQNFCNQFKNTHKDLDILINNAGIYNLDYKQTMQGFEQNFGVNYLSSFLLTMNLLECIPNKEESRIIFVASRAYRDAPKDVNYNYFLQQQATPYRIYKNYGISKLANIYEASSFAQYLKNTKIQVYSLHPGVVHTNMLDKFGINKMLSPLLWYFTKTPEQGSVTSTYLATTPNHNLKNGYYYKDCEPSFYKSDNNDLFEKTKELLTNMGYLK